MAYVSFLRLKEMVFKNELISEEEKKDIPFPVQTGYNGSKPTLWKWTIDRETNTFLVLTHKYGGGYEGTKEDLIFILHWNDNNIKITAQRGIAEKFLLELNSLGT